MVDEHIICNSRIGQRKVPKVFAIKVPIDGLSYNSISSRVDWPSLVHVFKLRNEKVHPGVLIVSHKPIAVFVVVRFTNIVIDVVH